MRNSIILMGFGMTGFGLFLWYFLGYPLWITGSIGFVNIALGIVTPKSHKVDLQPEPSGSVKLVIDKIMYRYSKPGFGNYELVFLNDKLVMKKLSSRKIFLIVGVFFAALGGLVGGLTAFSVQEFLDQRKRDKIRDEKEFATLSGGDMEILYRDMSQVRLTGLSLNMVVERSVMVFHMGAEYPPLVARRVREIIPNECWEARATT